MTDTELRERLARIDAALAQHDRDRAQVGQLNADHDRKRQEIRFAPWQIAFAGMTAGAALMAAGAGIFAAGGAFLKAMGGIG
jgi:hypothetical protein